MPWPKGVVFSQSRYRKFSGVCSCEAELVLDAYQRSGKGRHRAGLNFGDCFAYALCKATGQPPSHASVARMNTRSRSSRVKVKPDTVGRHRTTMVDHVSDGRGLTSYTMHVSNVLAMRDKTDVGFDHGVGHSLLLLYDAKAPHGQKSIEFKGLGHDPSNTSISLF